MDTAMNNGSLTCGIHDGEVVDVDVGASRSSGNEMVTLKWMLEGGQMLRSYHVTKNAQDGTKYARTIAVLRAVFREWDGFDANWFVENADRVIGTRGRVLVTYKEWNGQTRPSIERIAPPLSNGMANPPPTRPAALPSADEVELTINGVWRAFCQANPTLAKPQLDEKWFDIEDRVIVPQKDQMSYTTDDWRRVLDEVRRDARGGEMPEDAEEVF